MVFDFLAFGCRLGLLASNHVTYFNDEKQPELILLAGFHLTKPRPQTLHIFVSCPHLDVFSISQLSFNIILHCSFLTWFVQRSLLVPSIHRQRQ
ncbi:hypothetical protein EYC80_005265 [Monilinia laxa]|uniref:Uncharacterized protein n=1 Tax=Monilinia laxa TaxID=61186 RepID=A0A5N6KJC4_MONLA|nr:hypothetical protein EYC80_005265 [Monilinia laxa]